MNTSAIKRRIETIENYIRRLNEELDDCLEILETVEKYKEIEADKERLLTMNRELMTRLADPDAATPSPEIIIPSQDIVDALTFMRFQNGSSYVIGFDPGKDVE